MTPLQEQAINGFFSAIVALRDTGIIRSHRYLGDLGEFLCADAFGINLANNLRQAGHDGHIEERRVQIKYHDGKSTTVDLGDPAQYEEIFVVLGPDSCIRPAGVPEGFLIYQITAAAVRELASEKGNFYCTKDKLPAQPTRRISLASGASAH